MSRSHMIYDDKPLQQQGLKTSRWSGKWNPEDIQRGGEGVLLQGVFHKVTSHVIQDSEGKKFRFRVFHIQVTSSFKRRYDKQGKEIEPDFGQTKLVNKGFLNSSYTTEQKGTPDSLTYDEVAKRLKSPLSDFEAPSHAHSLCFWGDDDTYNHVECDYGQEVRLKTKGDSLLIESMTKLETTQRAYSSNYTGGEKAGENWTDKIVGLKVEEKSQTPKGGSDEVDDDEWDD